MSLDANRAKKNLKRPGQTQKEWNLVRSGGRIYISTSIDSELAEKLEFWAPVLAAEKKINNNSSFAAARYVLENGIRALDTTMREKYARSQTT